MTGTIYQYSPARHMMLEVSLKLLIWNILKHHRMKKLLLLSTILSLSARGQQAKIHPLEKGLIPSIVLEKDTGKIYTIDERTSFYHVQGLSIVAFEKEKITWSKTFGLAKSDKNEQVTPNTRFQVASISKAATALGILILAEMYRLDLDADVNRYLKTWKIPEGPNTAENKVSIRGLLNHTAGVNIDGFRGYLQSQKIPTILDVLNGKGNTPKIEVVTKPSSGFSYSGGGYVILVKLIEDVSGGSFEDFMQQFVFKPLKMKNSSFNQYPLQNHSFGYDQDGVMAEGGWMIMPELAADGLWTTANDLALFCMAIQRGYNGNKKAILSKKWIDQMLQKSPFMDYGLGVGVKMDKENQYFFHTGQNPGGYCGVIIGDLKNQKGLVILTNSEDTHLLREIINAYAKTNDLGYARGLAGPQEVVKTIKLTEDQLSEFEGKYTNDSQKELEVNITRTKERTLAMNYLYNGYTAILHPIAKDVFFEIFTGLEIRFARNPSTNKIQSVERRGKLFLKD